MFLSGFASDIRRVSGKASREVSEFLSLAEIKRMVLEEAKISALEKEYGTVMTQSTSSIIYNENDISNSNFSGFLGTLIRGEWLETIGEPVFKFTEIEGCRYIECYVEGRAREKVARDLSFDIYPLRNAPDRKYHSTNFSNGDDLFLYIKSPVSGYLNVYLVCNDDDSVYCLLPYKGSDGTSFKVEADREYILFSKEKNADKLQNVDEYTLSASKKKEFNDIVVVFSTTRFYKAGMDARAEQEIPNVTSVKKFNKYLTKLSGSTDEVYIVPITLTITNDETDF